MQSSNKKREGHSPEKKSSADKKGLKSTLKYARYRNLWVGQILAQLADKFYIVLMVYLITSYWANDTLNDIPSTISINSSIQSELKVHTEKITLLATGIYTANTIPAIIFGAIAGIGADLWPKKKIMVISTLSKGFLSLLIPLCILKGQNFTEISWGYYGLLIITFLISFATQFFSPAEQSVIPLIIPKKNLIAANSIYQATSMGALIIGFAIGDPLLRASKNLLLIFGIKGGQFILLPLFYGFASFIIAKIDLFEKIDSYRKKNISKEIKDGILILRQNPSIKKAIFNLVYLYSLLAALYVLSISLATEIESLGPTRFGYLLALTGIGVVSGAIILGQRAQGQSLKALTSMGLFFITTSLIFLGQFAGSLSLTYLFCIFLGIGSAFVAIPSQTTIQRDTPGEQRGKVFGLQNNLINISLSLPLILAGALVSSIGLSPVLWILAALSFFAALVEQPWKRC